MIANALPIKESRDYPAVEEMETEWVEGHPRFAIDQRRGWGKPGEAYLSVSNSGGVTLFRMQPADVLALVELLIRFTAEMQIEGRENEMVDDYCPVCGADSSITG